MERKIFMDIKGSAAKLKSGWKTAPEGRYLSFREMTAYGVGGMGQAFVSNIIYLFISASTIPYMYGIDVIHGTNITVIVTILNLVVQPVFAKFFDNTKTKWGKFKPYFALMGPIVSAFVVAATFIPQMESATARVVYAYITCIPTIILGNLWMWIFQTMPGVMTPNSQERTDMLSPVALVTGFAPTLLNVIVGPIRSAFAKQGREYLAFRYMGIVFVVIGLAMAFILVKYVQERVYHEKEQSEKTRLASDIREVLKNKPFMIYQMANVFNVLKAFMTTQLYFVALYKYSDIFGDGATIYSALSLLTGFGATPAMILAPFITRKVSKRNLLIFGQVVSIVPLVGIMVTGGFANLKVGIMAIIAMTVTGFILNFNGGFMAVVSPVIGTEQYDYQQYLTGKRQEGAMSAVAAWTSGILGTLLTYVPTFFQKQIGFQQGEKRFQSNEAYLPENMAIIDKWFNVAALITIVASLLYILFLFLYRFNEKEHQRIMAEIKERSGGSDNFDESTDMISDEAHADTAQTAGAGDEPPVSNDDLLE